LSRTREEETRKRSDSGGLVLAGDTADGDWHRQCRLSPVVGRVVAARALWYTVMGRRAACVEKLGS